jgi:hypothetical protein
MADMAHRRLGHSGLVVSVVGLGCNNFGTRLDAAGTARVVHAALDHGITLFDTAASYGQGRSEEMLGAALKGRRDDAVVATKFAGRMGLPPNTAGGSRGYILAAVEDSLRRLAVDHIDLYQMHVPDPATPIEETLRALDTLVTAGKVRYIGCSNFAGWQIAEAALVAGHRGLAPFVSAQNNYSLAEGEPGARLRAGAALVLAREQAAGDGVVGDDGDPLLQAQGEELTLDLAEEQVVTGLHRVEPDQAPRLAATDGASHAVGQPVRHAGIPGLAAPHHRVECVQHLVERRCWIVGVELVEVDVVGAEPAQ